VALASLLSVLLAAASLDGGNGAPPTLAPASEPAVATADAADAGASEAHPGPTAADDEELADDAPEATEAEAERAGPASDGGLLYSQDLSDQELERRWVNELPSLGSISVGFAEAGRLINGVQVPKGEAWDLIVPEYAWGTQETVDALTQVATVLHRDFPQAAPLRINHIGKKEGGSLRPHQSHQSGRDVDLGFFYKPGVVLSRITARREDLLEVAPNWFLLRALVTSSDVQLVLVDRRVQKLLYEYALAIGEDQAWLDRLFHAGADSLVQHSRGHRDHFHVRFFAPRSQELGRRVQPLLARRPEENLVIHRVQKGDTLGGIAHRYGSGVKLIQRANGMADTMLRVGRTLNVPLLGPCTRCPLPPPLLVPPRLLPPDATSAGKGDAPGVGG
jgi:murein endopeptidase